MIIIKYQKRGVTSERTAEKGSEHTHAEYIHLTSALKLGNGANSICTWLAAGFNRIYTSMMFQWALPCGRWCNPWIPNYFWRKKEKSKCSLVQSLNVFIYSIFWNSIRWNPYRTNVDYKTPPRFLIKFKTCRRKEKVPKIRVYAREFPKFVFFLA